MPQLIPQRNRPSDEIGESWSTKSTHPDPRARWGKWGKELGNKWGQHFQSNMCMEYDDRRPNDEVTLDDRGTEARILRRVFLLKRRYNDWRHEFTQTG